MARFSEDQLRDKALLALTEVYRQAEKQALPKSLWLRFLLAYLARGVTERSSFDNFWKAATQPIRGGGHNADDFGRHQTLSGGHKRIYRLHGYEPPD